MTLSVVIDPGHGFVPYSAQGPTYSGATAPDGTREDVLALTVANLVWRVLTGWPGARLWVAAAYRTRSDDFWGDGTYWPLGYPIPADHIPPDLNGDGSPSREADAWANAVRSNRDRVVLAERLTPVRGLLDHVYVSIHFNWSENPARRGVEVIYPYAGTPDRVGRSTVLGALIYNRLLNHVPGLSASPDGLYQDRRGLYVLERNSLPACLVELAYLTNPDDLALAKDPTVQWQMALAICYGLWDYYRWLLGALA